MSPDTQCILIVEDESAIHNILRANLLGAGYRVIEAGTGAEADVQTRGHRPDLVLVDLGLPDVDGLTLLARVRAGLRRVADQSKQSLVLQLGSVQVDLEAQTCRGAHGSINLTPQEFRVLDCLGRRAGLLVLRRELLRQVWGPDRSQDDRNLRTCIKNLRNKLEPDPARPSYLVTEVGLGYRLRAQLDGTQRNSGLTHQLT